jgi:hypothetical protein
MNRAIILAPIVLALAACGTTNPYDKRADELRKYREEQIERTLKETPKWMTNLPTAKNAVYAAGQGYADSYAMAVHAAKTDALSHVCYTADGRVTSQTKDFATGSSSTSSVERATRTNCNSVDVTGVEIVKDSDVGENPKVIRAGTQFTAFVLIALPTGDANPMRVYKDTQRRLDREAVRADKAFKEIENN